MYKTLAITALMMLMIIVFTPAASGSATREIAIGDTGLVIKVPGEWRSGPLSDEDSMKLHLRSFHEKGGYNDFDVFVLAQGTLSRKKWIEYYRRENLPLVYGRFCIHSMEDVSAGPFKGKLFHVLDLERKKGYGLLESLVFTENQVVFLRYLYLRSDEGKVRVTMDGILSSLTDSPEALARAELWYSEGRTLGLDQFGIFLRLPEGWIPVWGGKSNEDVLIRLSSGGSLRLIAFKRVFSGMKGLKKAIEKSNPGFSIPDRIEPTVFGIASNPAFHFEKESPGTEAVLECILGLHGKGGYTLVLTTTDPGDRELLRKVGARALLMDPRKSEAMRRDAVATLKKSLRKENVDQVREAVSTLVLFSGCDSAAKAIASGLKANAAIQTLCATALGQMGSEAANTALQRALANGQVTRSAKEAYRRALGMTASTC